MGGEKIICVNRKARHNFFIDRKIEAGVVLQGSEVKSCRDGKVQLVDSFAIFENGELFLLKAHIAEYKQGGPHFNHEEQRKRKLLLHRRELRQLKALLEQKGFTLLPLRMYFLRGKAKVELGLGKGKSKGDKRETLKKKDEDRRLRQELKRSR